MTIRNNYLDNLRYWQKITNTDTENLNIIYGGDQYLKTSGGNFKSWRKVGEIRLKMIEIVLDK